MKPLDPFTPEEMSTLLESAWFAMRHHYEDLGDYLDISDQYLTPLVDKLDEYLNE